MKITAILTKYKRIDELEHIINYLKQFEFIDEILICDNTKQNLMSYARYETMHLSRNDTIYLQDDDCIIEDLPDLYAKYDGTRLVNGFKAERLHLYRGKDTMLGWGAFLDRMDIPKVGLDIDKVEMVKHGQPLTLEGTHCEFSDNRLRAYTSSGQFLAILRYNAESGKWQPEKVFLPD